MRQGGLPPRPRGGVRRPAHRAPIPGSSRGRLSRGEVGVAPVRRPPRTPRDVVVRCSSGSQGESTAKQADRRAVDPGSSASAACSSFPPRPTSRSGCITPSTTVDSSRCISRAMRGGSRRSSTVGASRARSAGSPRRADGYAGGGPRAASGGVISTRRPAARVVLRLEQLLDQRLDLRTTRGSARLQPGHGDRARGMPRPRAAHPKVARPPSSRAATRHPRRRAGLMIETARRGQATGLPCIRSTARRVSPPRPC